MAGLTPDQLYLLVVSIGFFVGPGAYCASSMLRGKRLELEPFIESAVWGAGVGLGVHLLICAAYPEHLVHATDADGRLLHPPNVVIQMDMAHRIHIGVGALATIFLACRPLFQVCVSGTGHFAGRTSAGDEPH